MCLMILCFNEKTTGSMMFFVFSNEKQQVQLTSTNHLFVRNSWYKNGLSWVKTLASLWCSWSVSAMLMGRYLAMNSTKTLSMVVSGSPKRW